MKKLLLASAALALMLAACAPSAAPTLPPEPEETSPPADVSEEVTEDVTEEATDEATEPPEDPTGEPLPPAGTPEPEPAEPPDPVDVDVPGAAGLTLKGTFYGAVPNAAPAVLLLHMYGESRATWHDFALLLQAEGIASLAIDLRGHGATGGAEDWALAPQDVSAALNWLAARDDVDADRLGAAGASIGANLTMVLGSSDDRLDAIGLLSPGFDYFRVEISGLMQFYGDRPALLAAAEGDGYSAETVRALDGLAIGPTVLLVYTGTAHGTDMFATHPELIDALLDFFVEHLMG